MMSLTQNHEEEDAADTELVSVSVTTFALHTFFQTLNLSDVAPTS
jgi:hypothetical protein